MELVVDNPAPVVDPMEGWDLGQLNVRRDELMTKARELDDDLGDDDLQELIRITALMRRRSAGPPKEPKVKGATKVKKGSSLDDVL